MNHYIDNYHVYKSLKKRLRNNEILELLNQAMKTHEEL